MLCLYCRFVTSTSTATKEMTKSSAAPRPSKTTRVDGKTLARLATPGRGFTLPTPSTRITLRRSLITLAMARAIICGFQPGLQVGCFDCLAFWASAIGTDSIHWNYCGLLSYYMFIHVFFYCKSVSLMCKYILDYRYHVF